MTAEQKQSLARFLDLAGGYLGGGYARPWEAGGGGIPAAPLPGGGAGGPVPGQAPADTLEGIAADIRSCRSCPLGSLRTMAVPGEGAERPLVLVVGEGPGQDEDRTGRPFAGPAGQLLDKMLASIGLRREQNCFIANVVKCRPPGNRDPEAGELSSCAPYLSRQIHCLKPRAILCLGRVAANSLLGNGEGQPIGGLRGRFFDYSPPGGGAPIPLIATYHPSALLRNEEWKRPVWEDLKKLRARIGGPEGS